MKIRNAILAVVLVLVLMTASACSLYSDPNNTVTLNLNGGTVETTLTTYTPGEGAELPEPTREHYVFDGWYASEDFSGEAVDKIGESATGNLSFWAKWTPEVYTVTLNTNGGTVETSLTEYTYGVGATLPSPAKNGYDFIGWIDSQNQTVTEISETDYGNKEYWAQWTGATYSLTLNLNGGNLTNAPVSYVYGNDTPLPEPARAGYDFWGWYESSDFSGDPVEKISATDKPEDRVFYAKWEVEAEIRVTAYGGYNEGAYLEFELLDNVATSAYTVSYSVAGKESYTNIDSQLIRFDTENSTARADVVGIAAGNYDIKLAAGSKSVVKNNVAVTAYDRSGYAHFDATASDKTYAAGVGGYTNTGVPKSGAVIVYVTEETKNSVTATIGGKSYTGLANILGGATSGTPVIVRILGRIAAPTWAHDGTAPMIKYTKAGTKITADEIVTQTKAAFSNVANIQSQFAAGSYTQDQLTAMGFELEKGITALNGLTSKMTVADDTDWNDMQIGGNGTNSRPKNVTVEGIGNDAEIFQWGMTWKYASSIEIRNLTFTDFTEDACSFQGGSSVTDSERLWVHNCTFNRGKSYWDLTDEQDKADGDGSTDFKLANYITVSYNHYVNNHKTGLVGANSDSETYNITFHHNYYDECESRLPLARRANMHMYNNYYHNSGTSISLRAYAYAFIEECYFDGSSNTMIDIQSASALVTESYGIAKIYNCTLDGYNYSYQTIPDSEKPASPTSTTPLAKFITIATNRWDTVASFNKYENFDTDSSLFYYDSVNKKSNVTRLDLAANVPDVVKKLAGALK